MIKEYIQKKLERYVVKYFKKHPDIKLIAVVGSVGKTSAKMAIATVLSERFNVRVHDGNFNTNFSAPLSILGIEYPKDIRKIGEWLKVFKEARLRIRQPSDVAVIVQELGTDRIGQIPQFGTYLRPDIAVVTAISPEHMEFFGNMDNVAKEELSVMSYSKFTFINRDDVSGEYSKYLTNSAVSTYGLNANAEYHYISNKYDFKFGHEGIFIAPELESPLKTRIHVLGEHTMRQAIVAGAVAVKLGLSPDEIARGFEKVHTQPGRMNVLRGVMETVIIDDTYNSSPLAVESALRALYQLSAPQRIVVLGSMNELGDSSIAEHERIGKLCDPSQINWVITVGNDANNYIAPAAKSKGCQVKCFDNAIQAGSFVHSIIESGAVLLFKGSEGGIYLEEAVKIVLHSTVEESILVRQSPKWMEIKNNFFSKFS